MSVQSQIDRIKGELSTQSDLISQIKAALQGKVTGGRSSSSIETCTVTGGRSSSSIETCTVTIQPMGWDADNERLVAVTATVFENGSKGNAFYMPNDYIGAHETVTLNNIICGSVVTLIVNLYAYGTTYIETNGTLEIIDDRALDSIGQMHIIVFTAPQNASEDATLYFSYEQ